MTPQTRFFLILNFTNTSWYSITLVIRNKSKLFTYLAFQYIENLKFSIY